jgi:hypothetical protein
LVYLILLNIIQKQKMRKEGFEIIQQFLVSHEVIKIGLQNDVKYLDEILLILLLRDYNLIE